MLHNVISSFRGRPRGNENRDASGDTLTGVSEARRPYKGVSKNAAQIAENHGRVIVPIIRVGAEVWLAEACCHPPRHNRGSQFLLVHRSKCSATRRTLVILFCFEGFCPLQLHHANCMLTRSILRLGMLRGFVKLLSMTKFLRSCNNMLYTSWPCRKLIANARRSSRSQVISFCTVPPHRRRNTESDSSWHHLSDRMYTLSCRWGPGCAHCP